MPLESKTIIIDEPLTPLVKGSYREFVFTAYEDANKTVPYSGDFSNDSITILMQLARESTNPNITKKNTTAGGGDTEISSDSANKMTLKFMESDTSDLKITDYVIIIKITNPAGRTFKVIRYLSII